MKKLVCLWDLTAEQKRALEAASHDRYEVVYCVAIDVTVPEPLPVDSKLWKAPNLILTPHVAGGYHLPETFRRIFAIALDNLKRFANGVALVNEVDFTTGYRK